MEHVLTVSEYNTYFKTLIDYDPLLQSCRVEGEVTSAKSYRQGQQLYFNISDGQSNLNCVMYNAHQKKAEQLLEVGKQVVVQGKCQLFKQKGSIIFQVAYAMERGAGDGALAFEELKAKLLKEGLFDADRKQAIPPYPQTIHVITASNSAALADFCHILERDAPHLHVSVIPSTMQGARAVEDIRSALKYSANLSCDLCVLTRGGGSKEELATFNEELLVRAVSDYPHPIITAIGHDIDFSLTDMASDLRMPTPTAAAETICDPFTRFKDQLRSRMGAIHRHLQQELGFYLSQTKQWSQFAKSTMQNKLDQHRLYLEHALKRLETNNPLLKLQQGYSVTRMDGQILKSCEKIPLNATIQTDLLDGTLESTITKVNPK